MEDFEKWKTRYDKHWATKEQLKKLVQLTILTEAEYLIITAEDYRP